MTLLPFSNRTHAGRLLGEELVRREMHPPVTVLALPRGGVPVAAEVAQALQAPLDVVLVRKLGVPWQPELAMGAIANDGFQSVDDALVRGLGISRQELHTVMQRERLELRRRESLYRGGRAALDVTGRGVLLVDDGLATGATMLVAVRYARSLGPRKVWVAVPVGSKQARERVGREADACICLAEPDPFEAVGRWYVDFDQVTDAEVQRILARHQDAGLSAEA